MKAVPTLTLCATLALGVTLCAQQPAPAKVAEPERVQVTFIAPEKFADFRNEYLDDQAGQEHLGSELTKHLQWLGRHLLEPGQRLEVRFLDIDLAGDFEPWRGINYDDIRIVKELYPPKAVLEFRLLGADGSVLREGRRELSDLAFMMNATLPANDPLRHDKELLSTWMRREFKRAKK